MSDESRQRVARLRREPPRFRPVTVRRVARPGPRLVRVTFGGADLEGLVVDQPAASVRLLLPPPGADELLMPSWNGNEFLLPDGGRPIIRTFTPLRLDPESLELDLEIVVHDGGVASAWADRAEPGDRAAISGTGRGYTVDPDVPAYLLAGDETAIPAISQLLGVLPPTTSVQVVIEVAAPDGRVALPEHPRLSVEWRDLPPDASPGDALAAAVTEVDLPDGARVWAAGEAAAVQRVRRHLFDERGLSRAQATVRGYWKRGRSGNGDDG